MPRKSRIDAPGALHHIIARGIERRKIFRDHADRNDFLRRLGLIIKTTGTHCLAWALIPNHFHLLLKTGQVPLSTVMLRLLTGYAVSYNHRHHRHGYLFQNRYKSILCQEERYLLELVRYIHLNPVRNKIVADMEALDSFPFTGHSVIMGGVQNDWQDVGGVLALFGGGVSHARLKYRSFIQEGIGEGKRDDLLGGGLVRSLGGWVHVKAMRKAQISQKADERILGDGDFVESVLSKAQERMAQPITFVDNGINLEQLAERVALLLNIEPAEIWAPGKERRRVQARSLLCYWASSKAGIRMSHLSKKFNLSPAAISLSVQRGAKIEQENNYLFRES